MTKDLKMAETLSKHLIQPNPTLSEFIKARHFLEPVIRGSFPGDSLRANRMWIMLLHSKIRFTTNMPPIDEAPDVPTMQFINEMVKKSYSIEEEKTRLKNRLKKHKLTTVTHDALELFLAQFESACSALEEVDRFGVDKKDYLIDAVPGHISKVLRLSIEADTYEITKTLLFRLVTHEELNPQKHSLNNAQYGKRAGGTGSMDETERQRCLKEGICFNCKLAGHRIAECPTSRANKAAAAAQASGNV
jgi:hypothetical protein